MAHNVFIKIVGPDVNGGSTSKGHEGQIEVLAWNHGFHQPTTPVRSAAGGGTVEKCNHSPFTFTKNLDSSTDDLLKLCWSGKHIDSIELTCYRSAGDTGGAQMGVPYLKVKMESCILQDISISGGPGDIPVENVTIAYGKVTYTYNRQDGKKGSVGADQPVSHDLHTNVVA